MDSQELVRQLIRGSANINRMREEINIVVGMILGFASEVGCIDTVNLSGGDIDWEFRVRFANQSQVQCWSRAEAKLIYSSIPNVVRLSMQNVIKIHQALPLLVSGMSKTVPALAEKWQPLLDAATAGI